MSDRCDECRFWKQMFTKKETHPDDQEGYCRRHAPKGSLYEISKLAHLFGRLVWAVEELANVEHSSEGGYTFHEQSDNWAEWPVTFGHEWCGEFEHK